MSGEKIGDSDKRLRQQETDYNIMFVIMYLSKTKPDDIPDDLQKMKDAAAHWDDKSFLDEDYKNKYLMPAMAEYKSSGRSMSLLDMIASKESHGDYNIVYGGKRIDLTSKTIGEVRDWQRDSIAHGSPSSAVGRYQFMGYTLDSLIKEAKGSGLKTLDAQGHVVTVHWGDPAFNANTKFDEATQNLLGNALLVRRGYDKFLSGTTSINGFMKSLSQEWASFPKDMGGRSYYAGDGLNAALIKPETVYTALNGLRGPSTLDSQSVKPNFNAMAGSTLPSPLMTTELTNKPSFKPVV